MLFNSYIFLLLFLPVTLVIFYTLAKLRYIKLASTSLVVASLIFYSYWDIRFLPLLLISIIFNYIVGRRIEQSHNKLITIGGVAINISLLLYYKYTGFGIASFNYLFHTNVIIPQIILPLGISFFTFTQIAYLVDSYRGHVRNYSFLNYSLFVTFFPHLIAGPILYHKDVIPQFNNLRNFFFSHKNMALGTMMFSVGLFKKVVIADYVMKWVGPVFGQAVHATFLEAWAGALAYAFQLYYDFSGYSDMAIGLGLMLNIQLPINFKSPYRSTSIIQFWNRWHITLVTFMNNYLFVLLGGNRRGYWCSIRNLMITMLVTGIWHGAGAMYIVWGGLNGFYLVVNYTWRKLGFSMPNFVGWGLTFSSFVVSLVIFRATSLGDAVQLLQAMFGLKGFVLPTIYAGRLPSVLSPIIDFADFQIFSHERTELIIVISVLLVAIYFIPSSNQLLNSFRPNWRWAIVTAIMLACSVLQFDHVSEFLYFQF